MEDSFTHYRRLSIQSKGVVKKVDVVRPQRIRYEKYQGTSFNIGNADRPSPEHQSMM